jgi:hypothetical protein
MRQFLPSFLVFVRKQPLFHIRTLQDYKQCGGIKHCCCCTQLAMYSQSTKSLVQWHCAGAWELCSQICYMILTTKLYSRLDKGGFV